MLFLSCCALLSKGLRDCFADKTKGNLLFFISDSLLNELCTMKFNGLCWQLKMIFLCNKCVFCHRLFTGSMFDRYRSYWRFAFKSWRQYIEITEGISRVMQSMTSSRIGPKNQGKQVQGTMVEVSKDLASGWARMTEGWQEGNQSEDHVSWPLSLSDRPGWNELLNCHWWSHVMVFLLEN